MPNHFQILGVTLIGLILFKGCDKAPKYAKPTVATPPAYKELTPDTFKETNDWKFARPNDAVIRGKWWEMFNDAQLNTFEEQLNTANQNIALADANFRAARALVKESRSQYFPTITTSPSIIVSRQSGAATHSNVSPGRQSVNYTLPFDATWEPDFWGRIRNTVVASASEAQATAADLQNVRLSVEAELAFDYYQLRSLDSEKRLLDTREDTAEQAHHEVVLEIGLGPRRPTAVELLEQPHHPVRDRGQHVAVRVRAGLDCAHLRSVLTRRGFEGRS